MAAAPADPMEYTVGFLSHASVVRTWGAAPQFGTEVPTSRGAWRGTEVPQACRATICQRAHRGCLEIALCAVLVPLAEFRTATLDVRRAALAPSRRGWRQQ